MTPVPEDAPPLLDHQVHSDCGRLCIDRTSSAYGGAERHTNNTGELIALLEALRWLMTQPQLEVRTKTIRIVMDSMYVLNLRRENWFPTTNRTLVLSCQQALRTTAALYPTSIDWIKAHTTLSDADTFWNKEADRLANAGVHRVGKPLPLEPVPGESATDSIAVANPASCSLLSTDLSATFSPANPVAALLPSCAPAVHVSLSTDSSVSRIPTYYPPCIPVNILCPPSPCDTQHPAEADYG